MYFFDQIAQAMRDDPEAELLTRINSQGGNPDFGMSFITKVQEMDNIRILGEGGVNSMALFALCYVEQADVIDTASGVFHRAAYDRWIEESEGFMDSIYYEKLVYSNKNLEKAFRAKVDVAALEALPQMMEKGWKLKDIFSLDSRHEVLLTAKDMKKIGLANNIIQITPKQRADIQQREKAMFACKNFEEYRLAASAAIKQDEPNKPTTTMTTLEELKAQNPALYAAAIAAGKQDGVTEGVEQEKARVEGWNAFRSIDAAAVDAGIQSGKVITPTDIAVFSAKAVSPENLKKLSAENPPAVDPANPPAKTEDPKDAELNAFRADLDAEFAKKYPTKTSTK